MKSAGKYGKYAAGLNNFFNNLKCRYFTKECTCETLNKAYEFCNFLKKKADSFAGAMHRLFWNQFLSINWDAFYPAAKYLKKWFFDYAGDFNSDGFTGTFFSVSISAVSEILQDIRRRKMICAAVSTILILQIIIAAGIVSAEHTGNSLQEGVKSVNTTFDKVIESDIFFHRFDLTGTEKDEAVIETKTVTPGLSDDELFEKEIMGCINAAKESFRGPGLEAEEFLITIFDLIPDADISDPDYLERSRGVVISLNYSSSPLNNLQRTLWAYEIDATAIVKEISKSGLEKETGFIIINMADKDGVIELVKFKLTAADAKKYSKNIDSGIYLKRDDWSLVETGYNSKLILYEDPDTKITSYDKMSFEDVGNMYNFLTREELKEIIVEKSHHLNMLSQSIFDHCIEENWLEASSVSEDLIEKSLEYADEADKYIVLSGDGDLNQRYIRCLESYSDVGMCFWYGTTFFDEEKIKNGTARLKSGIEEMNSIFDDLDIVAVDEYKIVKAPATLMLPDARRLNEVYCYRDISQSNDISVKIEDWKYRESYLVKNDESKIPVMADFDKKFFCVVVDITHLGYRGGPVDGVKTPDNSAFTLYYMGEEYKDSTPDSYINSVGMPYCRKTLDRREHYEGVLIYEVPVDFDAEDAYIRVNIDEEKRPVWSFKNPENSSYKI